MSQIKNNTAAGITILQDNSKLKFSKSTGLQKQLPSTIRTENLKKIAKERGDRLRTIRELTNKTLEEYAKELSINAGNLGRIERGEICLSTLLSDWITKNIIKYGIVVTNTWLLTGKGPSPQFIECESLNLFDYLQNHLNKKIDSINSNNDINAQEKHILIMNYMMIFLYQQGYQDGLITYVRDCKMEPSFSKGDIVGGSKVSKENIDSLHNKACIIHVNNQYIVRNVIVMANKHLLLLSKDNGECQVLSEFPKEIAIINFRMGSISTLLNISVPNDNLFFDIIE